MATTTPPHLRSIVTNDGAVIFDSPRNSMFTVNPTGAYIWHRLEQGRPIESIVTDLARETGIDEPAIWADVNDFFDELKSRHLIAFSESFPA